jgi:hypothetical protein
MFGTEGKLYLNNDDGEWQYCDLDGSDHVERPLPGIDGSWTWDGNYFDAFIRAVDHIVDLIEERAANLSPPKRRPTRWRSSSRFTSLITPVDQSLSPYRTQSGTCLSIRGSRHPTYSS